MLLCKQRKQLILTLIILFVFTQKEIPIENLPASLSIILFAAFVDSLRVAIVVSSDLTFMPPYRRRKVKTSQTESVFAFPLDCHYTFRDHPKHIKLRFVINKSNQTHFNNPK